MKLAIIFNGQGAHYEKMGLDFASEYEEAKQVFQTAENNTGLPIREWIENDPDVMKETRYAQASISAVSLAIYNSIKDQLPAVDYMAGLSLGEYSALMATEMVSLEEGFALLKERGQLMTQHCKELKDSFPVQMLAVIGMPLSEISEIVSSLKETFEHLYIANMNSSHQTVLAGSKESIKAFNIKAKEKGYKKGIPLKVEGPFHSPLMDPVCQPFRDKLDQIHFTQGKIPVISNTTVEEHQINLVKETLTRHLVEPVRWKQTIDFFKDRGISHIIQIGPGNTLANLLKREENVPEYLVVGKISDTKSIGSFLK